MKLKLSFPQLFSVSLISSFALRVLENQSRKLSNILQTDLNIELFILNTQNQCYLETSLENIDDSCHHQYSFQLHLC